MIESTQKEIDALPGVTEAHAPFYKVFLACLPWLLSKHFWLQVSAMYLKEMGDFAGYYREALRYLGVEDSRKMTDEEKHVQVFSFCFLWMQHSNFKAILISFAALLGEDVYNFGELVSLHVLQALLTYFFQLAHPILKSLESTPEKWLVEILFAFNSGDMKKFHSMEPQW